MSTVICNWLVGSDGFDHLLPSAKPYYQLLKDVGIFADSPQQVGKFVSSNWDNINDVWWESDSVQEVRSVSS